MQQLLLMAIGILLLGLTSCGTTHTNPDGDSVALGHEHSEDELAELCKNPGTDAELIETCKQLRLVYYKDLIDGGNNIFEPGCHRNLSATTQVDYSAPAVIYARAKPVSPNGPIQPAMAASRSTLPSSIAMPSAFAKVQRVVCALPIGISALQVLTRRTANAYPRNLCI